MSLITFQNSYARYLLTLPKHVIEQFAEEELTTAEWFNHPDVVSGPYMVTDFDLNHYVAYTANTNYWKGAPKIDKLNIRIVDGSQLYAGLQSGEIDITQQTMSEIPPEDYESVEALENVDVVYEMCIRDRRYIALMDSTITRGGILPRGRRDSRRYPAIPKRDRKNTVG